MSLHSMTAITGVWVTRMLVSGAILGLAALQPVASAGAQTAIPCVAPVGVAPAGITVTATLPNVTVQWAAVAGARRYAVARRNPDGTCWNLPLSGTLSMQEPIPAAPGTYQYQVGVLTFSGSAASQWMPFTVAPPPAVIAPRTITLVGFTAVGTSAVVAPRTIVLVGFTGTGTSAAVAPRTIALVGFTGVGTSAPVQPRTITLAGWTGVGQKNP